MFCAFILFKNERAVVSVHVRTLQCRA